MCTFANPLSLAGCAPGDLNLVYSASLISSFFFMASNSLLMSFPIFMITLSVRFFFSLNCSTCNKSFSVLSYVFHYPKTHRLSDFNSNSLDWCSWRYSLRTPEFCLLLIETRLPVVFMTIISVFRRSSKVSGVAVLLQQTVVHQMSRSYSC